MIIMRSFDIANIENEYNINKILEELFKNDFIDKINDDFQKYKFKQEKELKKENNRILKYFTYSLFGINVIFILAPYWTSIIWLIGIGLAGNRLFINIPYHFTVYLILSVIFTTIHTIHSYLCYKT